MNKEESKKANAIFEAFTSNASDSDVSTIEQEIPGMNKGPLKKVWDTITQLWALIKDPTAAKGAKAVAIGALLYVISPIDAIPDFIPGLGLLDDVAIVGIAVKMLGDALKKYEKK